MEILNIAIAAEKSIKHLAEVLGVKPAVIGNWRYRQRLPKGWANALTQKYGAKPTRSTTRRGRHE
jgi:DNA-binding transcriptional regulator YiaG